MVGMPHYLEKGVWFSVLEDYVNASPQRAVSFLDSLRLSNPVEKDVYVSNAGLDVPGHPTLANADLRQRHLREDWFGGVYNGQFLQPTRQRNEAAMFGVAPGTPAAEVADVVTAEPLTNVRRTGFWQGYYGNVEEVFRQTLIRGLEVSLGIAHGAVIAPGELPPRHLPIEFFWTCPQSWFEGWVSWRWNPIARNGQVNVVFATPAPVGLTVVSNPGGPAVTTNPMNSRAGAPLIPPLETGIEAGASVDEAPKGMWLISQELHTPVHVLSTINTTSAATTAWATGAVLAPFHVSLGNVICTVPSEINGGVAPSGRMYQ